MSVAPESEEATPLLSQSSSRSSTPTYKATSQIDTRPPPHDVEAVQATPEPIVERKWNKAKTIWRLVYFVLGVLVVGVFIKAWIDADDVEFDLKGALKKALGGGLSGAAAMLLQVATLMPLRTVMNYQYRYGTSTKEAIVILWNDGGYGRYYRGVSAALIQGPAARFGDTAANAGILALLQSNPFLRRLPVLIQTVFASFAAACFRMVLTPIDTLKTTLQTEGKRGLGVLKRRVKAEGFGSMWFGAWATAAATFAGHYPWFFVYNYLNAHLPPPDTLAQKLVRQAIIGFAASIASDSISNSLRVIKTYRQVNEQKISYSNAARAVIRQDGLRGLFGRGLKTRILTNGLQGIMFSILWKLFLDLWDSKTKS